MKKKIISFGIVFCLLFSFAVMPVSATSGTCGDGVTWELKSNGTLTISGTGVMDDLESLSPPWDRFAVKKIIVGDGITVIGKNAFEGCINATSATIGSNVTTISYNAFRFCQKIKSIVIPDSVTYIGDSAFYQCFLLDSLTIGNNVEYIGGYAFYDTAITSLSIPASVTEIGNRAFYTCESLATINVAAGNPKYSSQDDILFDKNKTVLYLCPIKKSGAYEIPSTVTHIWGDAFDRCADITAITIPEDVSTIGWYAFSATGISSITIPDKVAVLDDSLFFNCQKLSEINLGSGVTTICRYVFSTCPSLTSIVIPNKVTTIGQGAFEDCSGLTSIVIPVSVTTIVVAFNTCENLTDVYYTGTEAQWNKISISTQNKYLESATKHFNYVVPGTLSGTCGSNLNWLLDSEGKLTISGTGAMSNYFVGDAPWYSVKDSITSVVIGEGVTSIGACAFADCGNLVSISIPGSLTTIANKAFDGCTSLSMVHIKSLAKWCETYFVAILEATGSGGAGGGGGGSSAGSSGGYGGGGIGEGGEGGDGCSSVIKLMDTKVITTSNPLYYAHNLYLDGELVTELVIPEGVTAISDGAFIGCESITSVTIPTSVNSIGAGAFYACTNLADVYYLGTESGWEKVSLAANNSPLINASQHCTVETEILYGDVNNDGAVSAKDNAFLARHLANWVGYEETKINKDAADVNADGSITAKDNAILARHLANWTGYELLPYAKG